MRTAFPAKVVAEVNDPKRTVMGCYFDFLRQLPSIWPMQSHPKFSGEDTAEVALDTSDVIVRFDIGDELNAEQYPDGLHWSFVKDDVAGTRYLVKDHKIVEVTDVYETEEGFMLARRKT